MEVDRAVAFGAAASRPDGTGDGIRPRRYRSLLVLVLVLVGCTGGRSPAGPTSTPAADERIAGTLLVFTGFRGGLATIELPHGEPQPVALPEGFVLDAFFRPDDSIVAVVQEDFDAARPYLAVDGEEPVALASALEGGYTYSMSGDLLLAAECEARPRAYVLDVATPAEAWQRVPGSCGAALSPSADALVWSPDGRSLLEAPLRGEDGTRMVLDAASIPDMPPGMDEGVGIIGSLRWGPQGLAVPLGTTERQAAVVVRPDGAVEVTPLGNRGAGLGASLAWQPGGELLASGAWSNLEAVVRLSSEDGTRVVAMHPEPIAGLLWSPDGEALLAAGNSRWTFVASDGAWLTSFPVPRGDALPLAWRTS